MHNLLQYRDWAIAESFLTDWLPVVTRGKLDQFIKKQTPEDEMQRVTNLMDIGLEFGHPPVDANLLTDNIPFERDQQSGLIKAKVGSKNIAIISVVGPLTKYGDLCSPGMQAYQALLNRANNTPSIDGIVLVMDTPGGTIDGTPELALAVKNSTKPVGIFGDSLVASAGMWIAAQAGVIVANKNNPTQFGSIGAFSALKNYSKMMEAGNTPEIEIITAPQSTTKVPYDPSKPMTEDVRNMVKSHISPLADMIINAVKDGRGDKLDKKVDGLFTGSMFDAHKAKQIGLIDAVGTLQTALNNVSELAKEKSKQAASPLSISPKGETLNEGINENANMKFKSNLFSGLFGKADKAEEGNPAAAASADANVQAADEKVAALEAQLTGSQEKLTAAEARATAAEATVTSLTAQVSTLTGEKETLEATVAEQKTKLDAKPTGNLTTVIGGKKEEAQATDTAAAAAGKVVSKATQETMSIVEQLDQLK
jgi:protease-4